jgi:hypothetical protein
MPVVKVWCLPSGQSEEALNTLHQAIVKAVVSVKELGLKDETNMTNLFPPDQMQYGLGSEIVIEVSGLFVKPERTTTVRTLLARKLGMAVKNLYPEAKVEVFVNTFNQNDGGFWVSD